jgi:hypothetical protein
VYEFYAKAAGRMAAVEIGEENMHKFKVTFFILLALAASLVGCQELVENRIVPRTTFSVWAW